MAISNLDPCGGGAAGGAGPAGKPGGPNPATPSTLCTIFHDGWNYDTATLYQPPKDAIVGSVTGTADFKADNTYVLDYFIGMIANHFEGTYTENGGELHLVDKKGDVGGNFDFSATCGTDTKELVLTIKNADGSPSIIYGLHARPK